MADQFTMVEIVGKPLEPNKGEADGCLRIVREDGSVVFYDRSTLGLTSNPVLRRHRGWVACLPNGKPLTYVARRGFRQATPRSRIVRKFSSAETAAAALDVALRTKQKKCRRRLIAGKVPSTSPAPETPSDAEQVFQELPAPAVVLASKSAWLGAIVGE